MASKQPVKLFDIARRVGAWGIRIAKFFKHRIMTKRKNAIVIGGAGSPLQLGLFAKLSKTWEITHLSYIKRKTMASISDAGTGQQQTKGEVVLKGAKPSHISEQFLSGDNYAQIEKRLDGKQFDTVIVLPDHQQSPTEFDFAHEGFATTFISTHTLSINKNIFAYRLAHKYLTTSGVVMLSCSEKDFLKVDGKDQPTAKKEEHFVGVERLSLPSASIVQAQVTYLGVVLGDRDYTDLHSWSIVVLDKEYSLQDPQLISEYYSDWADGRKLPMPGSFALFKRKSSQTKASYVEYL